MRSMKMACNEGTPVFQAWQRRYPVESAPEQLIGSPAIKDIDSGLSQLCAQLRQARTVFSVPIAGIWLSLPELSADIDKMHRDGSWVEMGVSPASLVEGHIDAMLNTRMSNSTTVFAGILTLSHGISGYDETLVCALLREPCGSVPFPTRQGSVA